MWNRIVNPITGKKVDVNSKIGKSILRNYMKQIGGSDLPRLVEPPQKGGRKRRAGRNRRRRARREATAKAKAKVEAQEKYIEMIKGNKGKRRDFSVQAPSIGTWQTGRVRGHDSWFIPWIAAPLLGIGLGQQVLLAGR